MYVKHDNTFKYNLYDNKLLRQYVINNSNDVNSDKIIHHFPEKNGTCINKIQSMKTFLNALKYITLNTLDKSAREFIQAHLMEIIQNIGAPLEGNIFMYHLTTTFTELFIDKIHNLSNVVLNQNIKRVLEIGFNSGFSTLLLLLSNPNIQMTYVDIGHHAYTMSCYLKLKEFFGDRLNLIIGDSTKVLPTLNETYDVIHIDGGHLTEVAESDITQSYRLSKQGTILIMDDYNCPHLRNLWDKYVNKYNLQPLVIDISQTQYHDIKYVLK